MAFDVCHEQIVRALEKDGWQVDERPRRLNLKDRVVYIDIQAMRQVNGSRQQILLAEVKCFPDRDSTTRELYIAFGQYIIYKAMLAELDIATPLYLALPGEVYNQLFDSTVQRAVRDNHVKLVIVNLDTETVSQWRE